MPYSTKASKVHCSERRIPLDAATGYNTNICFAPSHLRLAMLFMVRLLHLYVHRITDGRSCSQDDEHPLLDAPLTEGSPFGVCVSMRFSFCYCNAGICRRAYHELCIFVVGTLMGRLGKRLWNQGSTALRTSPAKPCLIRSSSFRVQQLLATTPTPTIARSTTFHYGPTIDNSSLIHAIISHRKNAGFPGETLALSRSPHGPRSVRLRACRRSKDRRE